jgi:uncharacterized membrane protein
MKELFKRLMPFLLLAVWSTAAEAQSQKITGSVMDERGTPIPHASVVAKGSNKGTSTDEKGNFSLTVSNSVHTITISSINFQSQDVHLTGGSISSSSKSTLRHCRM